MEEVYDEDVGRAGFEAEDGAVGLGPGVEATWLVDGSSRGRERWREGGKRMDDFEVGWGFMYVGCAGCKLARA